MLSADEKIRELAMIVDKQKSDQQKLSRELEEVQAEKVRQCCGSVVVNRVFMFFELTLGYPPTPHILHHISKVSMEYLLREKLEKLVQSEIEARLHMYCNFFRQQ